MYSISRLQAILKPVTSGVFQQHVDTHRADRYSKGFGCQKLLVGMVYAQLSGARSLRSVQGSFNQHPGHHYHLQTGPLHRSTMADALSRRNPQPFADMAAALMSQCARKLRKEGQELLYLLDSTPIMLKGKGFDDWCLKAGHIHGIKVHMLMDAATACPAKTDFSAANVNDIDVGHEIQFTEGATYVFDKGYYDYNWWHDIHLAKARFVTRLKRNAAFRTLEELPVDAGNIVSDEIITLTYRHSRGGKKPQKYYGSKLRRIRVLREEKAPLELVTNDLESPADDIAALYKQRWQIELLFKWIKQHLEIKTFLGRSENAVKLQILCALIAYLLLRLYQQQQGDTQTPWMFLCCIRPALFERPKTLHAMYQRRRIERDELLKMQGGLL